MILLKNKDKKANIKIGNNIEIKDGNDFPFDLTLYGKSTQATRSGKNLFTKQGNATPTTDTTFWGGITNTTPESDGWCKVSVDNTNGTTTVFANQFTKRNTIDKLEVNKMYSILVEVRNLTMSGSSSTPSYLQLCETAKDSVWQGIQNYDLTIFKETNKVVFQKLTKTNFDSSLLDFRNFVSVPKGYKVEFEYRLMVVKGSYTLDTIGEYEAYGVMPSPDYPSPIESVGRKNLFDGTGWRPVQSGDGFPEPATGATIVSSDANNISFTSGQSTYAGVESGFINVKANETYMFSAKFTTPTNRFFITQYDENKIRISTLNYANVATLQNTSFTTTNDGYITIAFTNTTNEQTTYKIENIQLEKGTVATDYVPYEHTEISAEVTNANQWNNDLVINTTKSADGFTMADKWAVPLMTQSNVLNTFKPDTTYTIKVVSKVLSKPTTLSPNQSMYDILLYRSTPWSYFALNLYDKVNAKVGDINTTYTTITTPSDLHDFNLAGYCFFGNNDGSTTYKGSGSIEIQQIMLAEGEYTKDNFPDYVHYASNSLTIDLQGNELCSLPNGTKDELVVENGIAKITKRIGKVVLDGSESWSDFSVGDTNFRCQCDVTLPNILTPPTNPAQLFSNYFKAINRDNAYDKTEIGIAQYGSTLGKVFICAPNTILSEQTLASWKIWLSTHNVEVLYELAEPETINLGTVEMPHTYEGVSNITNSADTEMVVKYYKKFEFDKILRSGYNIDEQEYEIAKKQMANGKRKKILSSYVDCIIKIDLGLLDNKTYQEYKEQLEDGEYEYWSYKYNQYKKANFILTKPSITTEYAYDDEIGIDDMEITLEKSSDVS